MTLRIVLVLWVFFVQMAAAQLMFSEYVEGSGHNKALEIHNISSDAIDLDAHECRVAMYFNGSEESDLRINLHGTLPAGEVLVLYHEQGDQPDFMDATHSANYAQQGGFGWFNGNDAIELVCGGDVLDLLGEIGSDQYWGRDVTRRRVGAEWKEFDPNTFNGLGTP